MYLCVTSCICVLRHVFVCYVMYLCATSCICVLRVSIFASFFDFSVGIWNCSDSVVLFLFSILLHETRTCRVGLSVWIALCVCKYQLHRYYVILLFLYLCWFTSLSLHIFTFLTCFFYKVINYVEILGNSQYNVDDVKCIYQEREMIKNNTNNREFLPLAIINTTRIRFPELFVYA